MAGTLYVIATPLGNLDDLSPRALELLSRVETVACEDTRRTARLLARYGLNPATLSCHAHNEAARVAPILAILESGRDVALVSDGGTPGISDPGHLLVTEVRGRGIPVIPLPGPSAVVTLLSVSGLPADRFVFDGFLPHKGGERRRRLRELATERRTWVVFETPHRILEALGEMSDILGNRNIVLGRELTKLHEEILAGTAREILDQLAAGSSRGEFCIAVSGAREDDLAQAEDQADLVAAFRKAMQEHGDDRRAALRTLARSTGRKKAALYRALVEAGELD